MKNSPEIPMWFIRMEMKTSTFGKSGGLRRCTGLWRAMPSMLTTKRGTSESMMRGTDNHPVNREQKSH